MTTLFAPEATRQSPLHRNRPGGLRWRERRIAVFPGWLISSQSLPGCAFFERETVALEGKAFPPKGDRQGFQRARHWLLIFLLSLTNGESLRQQDGLHRIELIIDAPDDAARLAGYAGRQRPPDRRTHQHRQQAEVTGATIANSSSSALRGIF